MKIGYARVSSTDQNLDAQLSKLKECDKIFEEKKSGLDADRAKLRECLDFVREGDMLVVTRLDRLARSALHLGKIGELLEKKGVDLQVLDQNIDTSTPTGRLLFNMLGAIAQFENEIRRERQLDGIIAARKRGARWGRRKALSDEQVKELRRKRKEGYLIRELMEEFKIKSSCLYNYLKEK